jgi:putative hydrolase of the HAD superfamily
VTGRADHTIRAVTFDYWNTIVRPDPDLLDSRVRAWRDHYATVGHDVEDEHLRAAFAAVWEQHQAAWLRNEQYTGHDAARSAVGIVGRQVDDATLDALVELFTRQRPGVQLCDGVAELITGLHESGTRLGIICDVGFTPSTGLLRLLEDVDLLQCFTGWSFSDQVGWYKPAPEIFRHALTYLDVEPQQAAHIGDLRRTDVAGAQAMGMLAVRYRGAYDDRSDGPEGDHVVDHHDQVPGALFPGATMTP